MKGLMVSVMANVTNVTNVANMAASAKIAANVAAVNANNRSVANHSVEKIGDSPASAASTETESSIISPPSTWPAWMQKAMMDDGRVAFRGSKIGIKVGKLHNEPCSLTEMLKIIEAYQKRLYPGMKQSDFRRRPTPSYLRRHCTCIAVYRAEEGSRADFDFSIILYDNGWFEYWGTGRRTTLYLPDCTEFVYKYNLAIDEIDKTTVNQSVLGSIDWYTVATLFAEERITQNMVGYGANASCDNAEAGVGTGVGAGVGAGEEKPDAEPQKVTEIVGATHIPTPEERLLKEERRTELSKIIAKATAKLTDKQAEVYKLRFEYEYPVERIGEMLEIPRTTAASRLMGVRARFSEVIKEQTGEDIKDYLNASSHKTTEAENDDNAGAVADVNDSKSIKDDGNDNDDNFENEIDDSNE